MGLWAGYVAPGSPWQHRRQRFDLCVLSMSCSIFLTFDLVKVSGHLRHDSTATHNRRTPNIRDLSIRSSCTRKVKEPFPPGPFAGTQRRRYGPPPSRPPADGGRMRELRG